VVNRKGMTVNKWRDAGKREERISATTVEDEGLDFLPNTHTL